MEYLLHILILIGIYIILSVSLNLTVGYCDLLSIAHAAFYGEAAPRGSTESTPPLKKVQRN